MILWTARRRLR